MIEQLRIDIEYPNDCGMSKPLYTLLVDTIEKFGYKVLDDGNAPYTEDMTEQYKELRGKQYRELDNHNDAIRLGY